MLVVVVTIRIAMAFEKKKIQKKCGDKLTQTNLKK